MHPQEGKGNDSPADDVKKRENTDEGGSLRSSVEGKDLKTKTLTPESVEEDEEKSKRSENAALVSTENDSRKSKSEDESIVVVKKKRVLFLQPPDAKGVLHQDEEDASLRQKSTSAASSASIPYGLLQDPSQKDVDLLEPPLKLSEYEPVPGSSDSLLSHARGTMHWKTVAKKIKDIRQIRFVEEPETFDLYYENKIRRKSGVDIPKAPIINTSSRGFKEQRTWNAFACPEDTSNSDLLAVSEEEDPGAVGSKSPLQARFRYNTQRSISPLTAFFMQMKSQEYERQTSSSLSDDEAVKRNSFRNLSEIRRSLRPSAVSSSESGGGPEYPLTHPTTFLRPSKVEEKRPWASASPGRALDDPLLDRYSIRLGGYPLDSIPTSGSEYNTPRKIRSTYPARMSPKNSPGTPTAADVLKAALRESDSHSVASAASSSDGAVVSRSSPSNRSPHGSSIISSPLEKEKGRKGRRDDGYDKDEGHRHGHEYEYGREDNNSVSTMSAMESSPDERKRQNEGISDGTRRPTGPPERGGKRKLTAPSPTKTRDKSPRKSPPASTRSPPPTGRLTQEKSAADRLFAFATESTTSAAGALRDRISDTVATVALNMPESMTATVSAVVSSIPYLPSGGSNNGSSGTSDGKAKTKSGKVSPDPLRSPLLAGQTWNTTSGRDKSKKSSSHSKARTSEKARDVKSVDHPLSSSSRSSSSSSLVGSPKDEKLLFDKKMSDRKHSNSFPALSSSSPREDLRSRLKKFTDVINVSSREGSGLSLYAQDHIARRTGTGISLLTSGPYGDSIEDTGDNLGALRSNETSAFSPRGGGIDGESGLRALTAVERSVSPGSTPWRVKETIPTRVHEPPQAQRDERGEDPVTSTMGGGGPHKDTSRLHTHVDHQTGRQEQGQGQEDPFDTAYVELEQQVAEYQRTLTKDVLAGWNVSKLRKAYFEIETLREDVSLLGSTIDIVEGNPARYHVDADEITQRRDKVRNMGWRLKDLLRRLREFMPTPKGPRNDSTIGSLSPRDVPHVTIELQDTTRTKKKPQARHDHRKQTSMTSDLSMGTKERLLDEKLITLVEVVDRLETQAVTLNDFVADIGMESGELFKDVDAESEELEGLQGRVGRLLQTDSKKEVMIVIYLTILFIVLFVIWIT